VFGRRPFAPTEAERLVTRITAVIPSSDGCVGSVDRLFLAVCNACLEKRKNTILSFCRGVAELADAPDVLLCQFFDARCSRGYFVDLVSAGSCGFESHLPFHWQHRLWLAGHAAGQVEAVRAIRSSQRHTVLSQVKTPLRALLSLPEKSDLEGM
jgi:hypothetical protein